MDLILAFAGAYIGATLAIKINTNKPHKDEPEVKVREIPKNIGRFSDPLGSYEKYRDEETGLYRSKSNRKVVNRSGEDSN